MSHEAHHEEHHHEGPEIDIKKSKTAFKASFWFMLILALLFIAALNFVNVMSEPEEGHGGGHEAHTEAPSHGTTEGHMEGGHADITHEPTEVGDGEGHEHAETSEAEHH